MFGCVWLCLTVKEEVFHESKSYIWDEPFLFKQCGDDIMKRCIPDSEIPTILEQCHASPYGGHFGGQRTAAKVFQSSFYWPTIFKDAKEFCKGCDQ